MRTTVDIDDAVLASARALASERGISLGAAISELAQRGLAPRNSTGQNGLPMFEVARTALPLTADMVREANEES